MTTTEAGTQPTLRVPYDTINAALTSYLSDNRYDDGVWELCGADTKPLRSELEIVTMLFRYHQGRRLVRLQVKHENGTRVQDRNLKQAEVWSDMGVLRPINPEAEHEPLEEDIELEAQRQDNELGLAIRELVGTHGMNFFHGDSASPVDEFDFIEVSEETYRVPPNPHMEPYTTVWTFIVKHLPSERYFSVKQTLDQDGVNTLGGLTEVFPTRVTRTEYVTAKEESVDE